MKGPRDGVEAAHVLLAGTPKTEQDGTRRNKGPSSLSLSCQSDLAGLLIGTWQVGAERGESIVMEGEEGGCLAIPVRLLVC